MAISRVPVDTGTPLSDNVRALDMRTIVRLSNGWDQIVKANDTFINRLRW
jgi:hypothetical protein